MASITLAEQAKLGLDQLVPGVIEELVTSDQMFALLPFTEIFGNSYKYNREATLADAQIVGYGDEITARTGGTVTSHFASLVTFAGDIELDNGAGAQGVGGNAGNDVLYQQTRAKIKAVSQKFRNELINGDTTVNAKGFEGLAKLVTPAQTVEAGGALTFEALDELLSKVLTKGGQVDALVLNIGDILKIRALKRALGGASDGDRVMVNGVNFEAYAGVPLLRNDFIKTDPTDGSTIYAVNFEDGTGSGIGGLVDQFGNMIQVRDLGPSQTKDSHLWRVVMYGGLALRSTLGVAALTGITS